MTWMRVVFFWLLMVGVVNTSISQNKLRPEIINYPNTVYQAQSQNWSVTQDENDFLFFGNNEGLLTYNGAQWQLFPMPKNQILRCVAADQHGKIYAGGFGSFGYFKKQPFGGYQFHSLRKRINDPLFDKEEIWKIIATDNQVLFQSFSRIHILQNGHVHTIVAPGTILFTYEVRGRFYVNVLGKGIYQVADNNSLIPLTNDPQLNNSRVTFILPYGTNQMLIGTERDGLFRYDIGAGTYSAFISERDETLRNGEINTGLKINDNLYAIGTISDGVFLMDAQGNIVSWINRTNGLQNNTILGMMTDHVGNLWLAMDKGIAQLVLKSNVTYFKDIQGRIGTVYSIAIYDHHIYVGSNHGLYEAPFENLADFNLDDLKVFPGIAGQVWDLKVIDNRLFVGNNTGTYVIRQGQTQKIYAVTGGWDIQPVKSHPDLLVQGTYNGVVVYHKSDDQWVFDHILPGTENMTVNKIAVGPDGTLWVKHAYKGIYAIHTDSRLNQVKSIRLVEPPKNQQKNNNTNTTSLQEPTLLDFFQYGDSIMINNNQGIYRYHPGQNKLIPALDLAAKFKPYFKIEKIVADRGNQNGFWFIDAKSHLHYKNIGTGNIQHFSLNNHLFNMVHGFEGVYSLTDNQTLLTGEDGFVELHMNQLNVPTNFSAPLIREIKLVVAGKSQPLPLKYLQPDGSLVLPYRLNNLEVNFSLPLYDRTLEYAYRLGTDPAIPWSEWSTIGTREFSNLAPGSYSLQLKTSLSDKVSTQIIQIKNPWYFSIVARIIYLLLFIAINILLWKWHKHRLRTQKNALTEKMKEALALEQEKNANKLLLLRQEKLSEEVIHKSEDLAKLAMDLIKKKKVLKKLKDDLEEMKKQKDQHDVSAQIQKLSKSLNKNLQDEESDWHLFDNGFNKVHEVFFERLVQQYPELTSQDLRLAAYLKMNLTTKEIAPLLNISIRGVEIKRYRLRKKLHLGEHENLSDFMLKF